MKKLISLLCVLCLMPATIHLQSEASSNKPTPFEVATKMNTLGIVQGVGTNKDGSIDFNLGANLTRAELVTVIVRSFGQEQAAQLSKGAPSFADVSSNEWYSGYIAVAKNLAEQAGIPIGRDVNTFDPRANVSKAEAIVFVMKFLGIKVESSGANWYESWIAKAVEIGIISEEDGAIALADPASPTTRGEQFIILDFGFSAKVLEGGKSQYTSYVDSEAPQLTIDGSYPKVTSSDSVTLSGDVKDNKDVVSLTSSHVSNITVRHGSWSATIPLKGGENVIQFSAMDAAGNTTTKSVTIQRIAIKSVQLSPSTISMMVNNSYAFSATVMGTDNKPMTNVPIIWSASGGSIDAAGKFTSNTEGTFTITATVGDISATAIAYISKPEPVSTPPTTLYLAPIADQICDEGVNASINVSATIPPSASHSFNATGLPTGLSINQITGHISGLLNYKSEGVYPVTVTLTTNNGTVSRSFNLTVNNFDTTPEWKLTSSKEFISSIEEATILIDLNDHFIDADGDVLVFSVDEDDENSNPLTTLEIDDGILEMSTSDAGTYYIKVIATDNTPSANDSAIVYLKWIVNP